MKLAKQVLLEVLNVSNTGLGPTRPVSGGEMDDYFCIEQLKPRCTKVIVGHKESTNTFRPIELKTKESLSAANIIPFGNGSFHYLLDGYLEDELNKSGMAFHAQYSFRGAREYVPKVIKIVKDHGWMSQEKFYLWLIKQGLNNISIIHFFPDMKDVEVTETVIKHGDVTFVGFDETKHAKMLDIFDDADKALKKAGYGDLMYGKVYLVPKPKSTTETLADYQAADDSMRVFDSATQHKFAHPIRTIVHELGHRLYRKKLSVAAQTAIRLKFAEVMSDNQKKSHEKMIELVKSGGGFKVGDRVVSKKFGELEYGGVGGRSLNARKTFHKFYILKDGVRSNSFVPFNSQIEAQTFFKSEKQTASSVPKSDNNWLPSEYSKTSETEWFSEIFSFAVMDKDKEILSWIKELK